MGYIIDARKVIVPHLTFLEYIYSSFWFPWIIERKIFFSPIYKEISIQKNIFSFQTQTLTPRDSTKFTKTNYYTFWFEIIVEEFTVWVQKMRQHPSCSSDFHWTPKQKNWCREICTFFSPSHIHGFIISFSGFDQKIDNGKLNNFFEVCTKINRTFPPQQTS